MELFEEQVRRAPDAVAVSYQNERLTYDALNRRATRLALGLQARGVGPDAVVGVCAESPIDFVTGMLGVLKAGGAYLPLDPAYPAERLRFMLEDSGALAVVTTRSLAGEAGAASHSDARPGSCRQRGGAQ